MRHGDGVGSGVCRVEGVEIFSIQTALKQLTRGTALFAKKALFVAGSGQSAHTILDNPRMRRNGTRAYGDGLFSTSGTSRSHLTYVAEIPTAFPEGVRDALFVRNVGRFCGMFIPGT